jgi:hypothetical protein
MKSKLVLLAVCCLLPAVAHSRLSGTYTVKQDSTGDFVDLEHVGYLLTDSGICGDCVFELYGESLSIAWFYLGEVPGSDSWSITFRPGPGQTPVLYDGDLHADGTGHLRFEDLEFASVAILMEYCNGCRISRCSIHSGDFCLRMYCCSFDTIDGNRFREDEWGGEYPTVYITCGSNDLFYNNIITGEPDFGYECLFYMEEPDNVRLLYNSFWHSPDYWAYGSCLCIHVDNRSSCEVENNIFILMRPLDTTNVCVTVVWQPFDGITLDHDCYFVEDHRFVGAKYDGTCYDWPGWQALRFEEHGLNADPLVQSPSDLHLRQGSPCIDAAVPIPGIDFDIDGDPRDPVHPDIGADEFTGGAVEEGLAPQAAGRKAMATVVRRLPAGAVAFDAMGRRVVGAKAGVYFVRGEGRGTGDAGRMRKVVVQQ